MTTELTITQNQIQSRIFTIRGVQVMLDRDLAKLYEIEPSQMNRQVKRNLNRFPSDFMFQLTKEEWNGLKCQNGISNSRGGVEIDVIYRMLSPNVDGIPATIYTNSVGESLKILQSEYIQQYPAKPLFIKKWKTEQHDRWLIIDDALWHCGASLKDAGLKTFGIDLIGLDVDVILSQV